MEPVSGIDLLKVIRADRKLKATRFLIMTASMSTEAVVEARSAGVDNFILKPFTPEALHAKIVELI
jgi:two-component system, chemotaxis family, chemotaxis protein CheY